MSRIKARRRLKFLEIVPSVDRKSHFWGGGEFFSWGFKVPLGGGTEADVWVLNPLTPSKPALGRTSPSVSTYIGEVANCQSGHTLTIRRNSL